jgi:hypothetical protein
MVSDGGGVNDPPSYPVLSCLVRAALTGAAISASERRRPVERRTLMK